MLVKLCGMWRDQDIEYINISRPDYVGFIIDVPKSHRNISPEQLENLSSKVNPEIKRVGVFVNEDINVVADLLNRNVIDIAQLHGLETDEYISQLKSMTGDREVWKVFELGSVIDDSEKLNETLKMATDSKADRILFDSGKGSGVAFDRHVLDNFKKDYIFAGGLTPEKISELDGKLPYAVDLSSGIETDKKKDLDKMLLTVENVRRINGSK